MWTKCIVADEFLLTRQPEDMILISAWKNTCRCRYRGARFFGPLQLWLAE
jgi:hypothetical protein